MLGFISRSNCPIFHVIPLCSIGTAVSDRDGGRRGRDEGRVPEVTSNGARPCRCHPRRGKCFPSCVLLVIPSFNCLTVYCVGSWWILGFLQMQCVTPFNRNPHYPFPSHFCTILYRLRLSSHPMITVN